MFVVLIIILAYETWLVSIDLEKNLNQKHFKKVLKILSNLFYTRIEYRVEWSR